MFYVDIFIHVDKTKGRVHVRRKGETKECKTKDLILSSCVPLVSSTSPQSSSRKARPRREPPQAVNSRSAKARGAAPANTWLLKAEVESETVPPEPPPLALRNASRSRRTSASETVQSRRNWIQIRQMGDGWWMLGDGCWVTGDRWQISEYLCAEHLRRRESQAATLARPSPPISRKPNPRRKETNRIGRVLFLVLVLALVRCHNTPPPLPHVTLHSTARRFVRPLCPLLLTHYSFVLQTSTRLITITISTISWICGTESRLNGIRA